MRKFTRILAATLIGAGLMFGAARAETLVDRAEVQQVDPVARVMAAARVADLMNVVVTEGARHGMGLERSLFPGKGGGAWASAVSAIQSPERLIPMIGNALRERLSEEDATRVAAFLGGDLGARIVAREVDVRRRLLTGGGERQSMSRSSETKGDRPALIEEMIRRLDLLDSNVLGGLNANLAFYRGLGDGGALQKRLTEREMIAMVRGQEEGVRQSMMTWLRDYMTLAYQPFTEDELRRYIAFAETDAGRRYTSAMFAGFGAVFERTSYDLGQAAARFIAHEAI